MTELPPKSTSGSHAEGRDGAASFRGARAGGAFLPSRTPGNPSDPSVQRGEQAKRSEEVRGGPAGPARAGATVPHTRGRPGGRSQAARPRLELCPHDFPNKWFKHESKCNEESLWGASDKDDGVGEPGAGHRHACAPAWDPPPRSPLPPQRGWGAAAVPRCPEAGLLPAPSVRISEENRKCCLS